MSAQELPSVVVRLPIAFPKRSRQPLTFEDALHFAGIALADNRRADAIRLIEIAYSILDYGGVRK